MYCCRETCVEAIYPRMNAKLFPLSSFVFEIDPLQAVFSVIPKMLWLCQPYFCKVVAYPTLNFIDLTLFASSRQGTELPFGSRHFESRSSFHLATFKNEFLFVTSNIMMHPFASCNMQNGLKITQWWNFESLSSLYPAQGLSIKDVRNGAQANPLILNVTCRLRRYGWY